MRPLDDVSLPTSDTSPASSPDSASPGLKPPVSDRKLAANRANAAKSTGPATAQGKAKSSMNAVVHGMSPRTSLLMLGECRQELAAFYDDTMADLRPTGAVERALAERAVALMWRLRRAVGAEQALECAADRDRHRKYFVAMEHRRAWGATGPDPVEPRPWTGVGFVAEQFLQEGAGSKSTSPLERLAGYEQRLDRSLQNALRQLHQLRKARAELQDLQGQSADQSACATAVTTVDPAPVVAPSTAGPPNSVPEASHMEPDPHANGAGVTLQGEVPQVERVEDALTKVPARLTDRRTLIRENEPTELPRGPQHPSTRTPQDAESQFAENEPTADYDSYLLE